MASSAVRGADDEAPEPAGEAGNVGVDQGLNVQAELAVAALKGAYFVIYSDQYKIPF